MISATQKFAVDYAISKNPLNVSIERVKYTEFEGARKKEEITVPDQVWLLYPVVTGKKKVRTDSGQVDTSTWGALAPSTADVEWGANVVDTVTVVGLGEFTVESGIVLAIGTNVNGYQLELKRVK